MRSGLLFKIAFRKPNIFLNDARLFGYTFLQSTSLDTQLITNPNNQLNKSITQFLKTPFDVDDLNQAKFLLPKVQQHLNSTLIIKQSIKNDKNKLIENLNILADQNILDLDIWKNVFYDVLDQRFEQLQDHPKLDQAFRHMQAFFSRFDIKNSKFYLDKSRLPSFFTLKENCTSIFNIKKKIGSIRLQTSLMNFFIKASSRLHINLSKMRDYYKMNLIKNLPEILAQQNNIIDIAKLETVLDTLFLQTDNIRSIFTNRITEIFSQQQNIPIYDTKQYLTIATNWACIGEMRPAYQKIFNQTFDNLVHDSPAALLQAIVTCHKETPQLVDRVFDSFSTKIFQHLSRKPQIHRLFHILEIRGFDLSKYKSFVDKISVQNCQYLNSSISKCINVQIKSPCMIPHSDKQSSTFSPNMQYKWIANVLKQQFGNKMNIFYQTKICRYDTLFGFIKNNRIFVIQIPNLNIVSNKPKNYRGTILQKRQLFKYYNIQILELNISLKQLQHILHKKQKYSLIRIVKDLIESV